MISKSPSAILNTGIVAQEVDMLSKANTNLTFVAITAVLILLLVVVYYFFGRDVTTTESVSRIEPPVVKKGNSEPIKVLPQTGQPQIQSGSPEDEVSPSEQTTITAPSRR